MTDVAPHLTGGFWRTRRSAAIAGIIFGVLLLAAMIMLRIALSEGSLQTLQADTQRRTVIRLSLSLVPFAGIAFLWFIGVVREQLGAVEDRLFPRSSWAAGCSFWPCCLRGSDLGKSDSDARWSECQRRRLRVRPRYRPGTFLRLRHANGGGVHAIGQYRRAPDLGPAALGLIPGIPDGSGSSGGSRRAALDTTRVSKLGFAGQPGDSLRPAAQPGQHTRGRS
jgi:hypothetical protein